MLLNFAVFGDFLSNFVKLLSKFVDICRNILLPFLAPGWYNCRARPVLRYRIGGGDPQADLHNYGILVERVSLI